MKRWFLTVLFTGLMGMVSAEIKSSVSQWGITWTFDKEEDTLVMHSKSILNQVEHKVQLSKINNIVVEREYHDSSVSGSVVSSSSEEKLLFVDKDGLHVPLHPYFESYGRHAEDYARLIRRFLFD